MNTVGGRIYKLRRDNGVTQEELAASLEVSRQTVSRWEANLAMPTAENVDSICELFGVTADTFFKGLKQERIYINDTEVVKLLRRQYAARGNCYTLAFAIFFTAGVIASLFFSVYVGLCIFPITDDDIQISTTGYILDLFVICILSLVVSITMSVWLWLRFVVVRRRVSIQCRTSKAAELEALCEDKE